MKIEMPEHCIKEMSCKRTYKLLFSSTHVYENVFLISKPEKKNKLDTQKKTKKHPTKYYELFLTPTLSQSGPCMLKGFNGVFGFRSILVK